MKFEVGKYYKTRAGQKVKIIAVDADCQPPLVGVFEIPYVPQLFFPNGSYSGSDAFPHDKDLIAEWEEPEKKVTITKSQLFAATETIVRNWGMDWQFRGYDRPYHISEMGAKFLLKLLVPLIKELGLDKPEDK